MVKDATQQGISERVEGERQRLAQTGETIEVEADGTQNTLSKRDKKERTIEALRARQEKLQHQLSSYFRS